MFTVITECQAEQGLANWDQKAELFQMCAGEWVKIFMCLKAEHNRFTP